MNLRLLAAASLFLGSGVLVPRAQAQQTLYTSLTGVAGGAYGVVSSAFTDSVLGGFRTAGADDFEIADAGWRIERVTLRGYYTDPLNAGQSGPAQSFNLFILPWTSSAPTTTNLASAAVFAATSLPFTDLGGGEFEIDIPPTVLPAGRYWLVAQANIELFVVGQWNWTESSLTPNSGTVSGSESAWFQSAAGFASPVTGTATCVASWGSRLTSCQMTRNPDPLPPADGDLAFALAGAVLQPGVELTPLSLTTAEGGSSVTYAVVLTAPPAAGASVTVTPTSQDLTEGTVSGAVTFTSSSWAVPQDITLTPGASGDGADGDVAFDVTHVVTSDDAVFDGLSVAAVVATNTNVDGTGVITVTPASTPLVTTESGGAATVSYVLTASPTAAVTFMLSVTAPGEASVSPTTLTFDGSNWSVPQEVTVTGLPDAVLDGAQAFSVVAAAATSDDSVWAGVTAAAVSGENQDTTVIVDAGMPDQGMVDLDQGMVDLDAGMVSPDQGTRDQGTRDQGTPSGGSGGCSLSNHTTPAPWSAFLLAGALLLARRRRG